MHNNKTLAGKALRAMHQLWQILKEVESPFNISFNLFDTLVASVLNYGAEVVSSALNGCIENCVSICLM